MEREEFLYKKPVSKELKETYKDIFGLKKPIKERLCKLLFDKIFSAMAIILISPAFLLILLAYLVDGILHPKHRGAILSSYISLSHGRKFVKYKFRIHEASAIDKEARRKRDIVAYPREDNVSTLTCVGRVLKKHYVNELPQIFNILKGDISFVGVRPLAQEDYLQEEKNGHVRRKLLKAGVFSQTHVRKGTPDRYRDELDYDYISKYITLSAVALLWLDIKIITRGIWMVLRGEKKI